MDTNENVRKKISLKAIIILITVALIISGIGIAFARYITSLNGNTQVQIAQWSFNVTAGSSQNLSINLADTRYANDTTDDVRSVDPYERDPMADEDSGD